MIFQRKSLVALGLISLVASFNLGCGKKPTAPSAESTSATKTETGAPGAPAAPAAGSGSIKGKVAFTGTAPDMPELNREADPFCAKTKMKAQDVVVNGNGTLKNVAITLVGATGPMPAADVVVKVDQSNCMYEPRIQTGMFGQNIKIINSDPILHNVHSYSGDKTLFNRAQPKDSSPVDKTFSKDDGEVIKFKCDVHPWMTGWLVQSDSPYTAVTNDQGEFEIKGVPAGTYKLQSWQEKFGTKTVDVTVEADKPAQANVSYDGTEKASFKYQEIHIGHADMM